MTFPPSSRGDIAAFANHVKGGIICRERITSRLKPKKSKGFTT